MNCNMMIWVGVEILSLTVAEVSPQVLPDLFDLII